MRLNCGCHAEYDPECRFRHPIGWHECPLHAAATELLAACKQMVKSLNGSAGDFAGMLAAHRALDAAIAKAEGER